MRREQRKRIALIMLAMYVLMAGTLDLHHNHSSSLSLPGEAAIAAGFCCTDGETHAPCPVLLFSLSHAPGLDLHPEIYRSTFALHLQPTPTLQSADAALRKARSPPA